MRDKKKKKKSFFVWPTVPDQQYSIYNQNMASGEHYFSLMSGVNRLIMGNSWFLDHSKFPFLLFLTKPQNLSGAVELENPAVLLTHTHLFQPIKHSQEVRAISSVHKKCVDSFSCHDAEGLTLVTCANQTFDKITKHKLDMMT